MFAVVLLCSCCAVVGLQHFGFKLLKNAVIQSSIKSYDKEKNFSATTKYEKLFSKIFPTFS
jgi:hypothetical protein